MNAQQIQKLFFEDNILHKKRDDLLNYLENLKLTSKNIDLLEEEYLDYSRKQMHQYVTPPSLVRFLTNIINPKDNDIVLDPVCGTGSFLKEVHTKNPNTTLFGIDINQSQIDWASSLANLRNQNITYINQDSLNDFPPSVPKADYIFANLPFGARVHDKEISKNYEIESKELEVLLIQKIIKSLKESGIAFIIIPEGFLFKKTSEKLRNYISKNISLDAIVSLPSGTFAPYTSIKTSVIILSNRQGKETAIYELENIREDSKIIDDIRDHLSRKPVSYGEIVKNYSKRNSWSVSQYFEEIERQALLDSIPYEYKLRKLKNICKIESLSPRDIKGKKVDVIISSTYTPGRVLDLEDIQNKSEKARYFALKITEPKVTKDYLKSLLNSSYGNLEKVSSGMTIKTLNKSAIEDFKIPVVDEKVQNEISIKLSNIEAVKDKATKLITEVEKVETGDIFNIEYDLYSKLANLATKSEQYHSSLPKPIAMSYFSYKNTQNIDKKFDNIVTSYSTIIKTLGFIALVGLSTIEDESLPSKIREKIDPSRPISDGVWGKIVQLAVDSGSDMRCFLSDELKFVNYNEVVDLVNELTSERNKKAHNTMSYSKIQKEAFIIKFQNDLERLLDLFSFLSSSPLVYFEKTEKFPPQRIIHTVKYLVGDEMHDKEDNIEIKEDFYQTLYLLKNVPNKSISMYPLMLYEDSTEIESKDIYLFSGLDKRENPFYTSITKGEKIVREDYKEDVHRIFYYIPKK
jgi:SAM-dependent methyltransferase